MNNLLTSPVKHITLGLFVSLLGVSNPATSAIISTFSDDFEAEDLALNYVGFSNWDVFNGSVDTVGPTFGTPLINCQGSMVCVDVDGSTSNAADLTTKDDFAPNTYRLSFDISGSQRPDINTISVVFGDLSEDFTLAGADPWVTIVRTVTVSTGNKLTFNMAGGDNSGILLDNVSVAPVPIPAALWLFGSALGMLGWAGRKAA